MFFLFGIIKAVKQATAINKRYYLTIKIVVDTFTRYQQKIEKWTFENCVFRVGRIVWRLARIIDNHGQHVVGADSFPCVNQLQDN